MLHERKSRLTKGQAALSSPEPEFAPVRGRAVRVGAELRAARLQYGWDLEAVAASLRIRVAYLEALEGGRIADLPGNAYALGFLRTYATALGLDADEMSRRFRAEVAEVNAKTELTFPAPVPERGVPAGAVILLGVVLAIGAYVGWYRLTEHGAPQGAAAPVPPRLARLAEPTVLAPKPIPPPAAPRLPARPAPPAPQPPGPPAVTFAASGIVIAPAVTAPSPGQALPAAASATTAPGTVSPPETGLAMSVATGSAPAGSTAEAARAAGLGPPAAAAVLPGASGSSSGVASGAQPPSPLSAVAALAPPAQAAPVPPGPPGTLIVRAVAESWIEVRDATGAIVFTKLMQPGESWAVPREAGLTLTTGNAGGTQLVVDGTVAASLGAPGEVERNQPLDPGLIKSGALPAQIAAAATPQDGHSHLRLAQ
ncbi:MAG: helix-turn-helix domain-containing protein [Acetobacteraceae bacterium]